MSLTIKSGISKLLFDPESHASKVLNINNSQLKNIAIDKLYCKGTRYMNDRMICQVCNRSLEDDHDGKMELVCYSQATRMFSHVEVISKFYLA